MPRKTKQDVLIEIRDIQLESNKLTAERNVLADDIKVLFEAAGEATVRKENVEKEIASLSVQVDELKEAYSSYVDGIRENMRGAHEMLTFAIGASRDACTKLEELNDSIASLKTAKKSLEDEIQARKDATKIIGHDLDIYADRLTEAYKLLEPNRKVVVGSLTETKIDTSKVILTQEDTTQTTYEIPVDPRIAI